MGTVDPLNDFVEVASLLLAESLTARFGSKVALLPMTTWTRAKLYQPCNAVLTQHNCTTFDGKPVLWGVGRHVCAFPDYGGTHFRDEHGRMAFVQQVPLHVPCHYRWWSCTGIALALSLE